MGLLTLRIMTHRPTAVLLPDRNGDFEEMTRMHRSRAGALALTFGAGAFMSSPALAAAPQPGSGDTAWMLMATALVLMMTIPGLALFYGGLVRTKNTISMLMQVFVIVCMVSLLWVIYGYSIAYTGGTWGSYFGGLWKAFLRGIGTEAVAPTHVNGAVIPEMVYVAFQMTFACITPALIVGAFAERMRFQACLLFVAMWVTFVYIPIAHMAWYGPGPDALADAARAVQMATTNDAKRAAEAALALLQSDAGLFAQWGALDFAGGTVVHINAGIAGLVGAVTIGKRTGYGRESMAPHNLTMTMIGAALLWVGWFGFNAGSALKADGVAALAMMNTFVAAAAGALSWMAVEMLGRGKPSLLGLVTELLAGLVAVTPAAGYSSPMGAVTLGLVSGAVCYFACIHIKMRFQYDDSLDVFGVHCVAGVIGTLAVGILANPTLGGTGVLDYVAQPGKAIVAQYDTWAQLWAQFKAIVVTLLWSSYVSARLYTLTDMAVGLRPAEDEETEGLDVVDHGERAYNI